MADPPSSHGVAISRPRSNNGPWVARSSTPTASATSMAVAARSVVNVRPPATPAVLDALRKRGRRSPPASTTCTATQFNDGRRFEQYGPSRARRAGCRSTTRRRVSRQAAERGDRDGPALKLARAYPHRPPRQPGRHIVDRPPRPRTTATAGRRGALDVSGSRAARRGRPYLAGGFGSARVHVAPAYPVSRPRRAAHTWPNSSTRTIDRDPGRRPRSPRSGAEPISPAPRRPERCVPPTRLLAPGRPRRSVRRHGVLLVADEVHDRIRSHGERWFACDQLGRGAPTSSSRARARRAARGRWGFTIGEAPRVHDGPSRSDGDFVHGFNVVAPPDRPRARRARRVASGCVTTGSSTARAAAGRPNAAHDACDRDRAPAAGRRCAPAAVCSPASRLVADRATRQSRFSPASARAADRVARHCEKRPRPARLPRGEAARRASTAMSCLLAVPPVRRDRNAPARKRSSIASRLPSRALD